MCDSCNGTRHNGRRWSTSLVVIVGLLSTLALLAIVGVVVLGRHGDRTASPCAGLNAATALFARDITRDLAAGRRTLVNDTAAFTQRAVRFRGCPGLAAFAQTAHATLTDLCPACASRIKRTVCRRSDSAPTAGTRSAVSVQHELSAK